MESTMLQAPRPGGGRSRFSKALPAPPPGLGNITLSTSPLMFPPTSSTFDLSSNRPPAIPPRKALPSMPSIVSPISSITPRPLDSPLPPPPLSKVLPSPPPAPTPAMSIKRRPVGGSLKSPDSVVSQSISQPTQPTVPPPEPSPTDSLSSLFSAYSRSSGESLVRSSQGTANTKISYAAWSPEKDAALMETPRGNDGVDAAQRAIASTSRGIGESQSRPRLRSESPVLGNRPPPPSKDDLRPTTPMTTRSPAAGAPPSPPPKTLPSLPTTPPQPQLWRRRSQKAVADLNLNIPQNEINSNSHLKQTEEQQTKTSSLHNAKAPSTPSKLPFTTTSVSPFPRSSGLPGRSIQPTQQSRQQNPPHSTTAGPSAVSPLPQIGGLPGKSIRPTRQQDQPHSTTPVSSATMGNENSKLVSLKEKWEQKTRGASSQLDNSTTSLGSTTKRLSPIKRLPTPDYEPEDAHHQLVETIVSPASPATSPEMPAMDQGARTMPIARRPVGSTTSSPSLRVSPVSNPGQATSIGDISPLPSIGPARGRMNQFPVSPVSGPAQAAVTSNPMAPSVPTLSLDTSQAVASSGLGLVPIEIVPAPVQVVSPLVESPIYTQTVSIPAVEDDLVPGEGQLSPSSAAAAFFPRIYHEIRPAGYVFPAKPLTNGHYNCFIGHKTLHANKNDLCPLRCQTCEKDDKYLRYTCSMCNLRVCRSCKDHLLNNGRDLRQLMEHIQTRNLSETELAEMEATDAQVDASFKKAQERSKQQAEEREQMLRQRRQQQQQLLRPPRPHSSGSQGSASSATSGYFNVPPPGAPGGGYGTPRPNTPTQDRAVSRS